MIWIYELRGSSVQIRRIIISMCVGGGHGVWNNQVGSQKWLPPPNAVVRLNSDSPVVET